MLCECLAPAIATCVFSRPDPIRDVLPYGQLSDRPTLSARIDDLGRSICCDDNLLDASLSGPRWLAEAQIANIVRDSIEHCACGGYDLHSWVIMPNHVHMLITPSADLSRFMRRLKGFTARQANALLNRHGRSFWQDESYDHVVRSSEEFHRVQNYIVQNPVKAGLARTAEEFPWSSVSVIRG